MTDGAAEQKPSPRRPDMTLSDSQSSLGATPSTPSLAWPEAGMPAMATELYPPASWSK